MNIGDICTREVVMADQASSLQQAAALMRQHHVGALVVTAGSADGVQAVGMVTDRDLVIEAIVAMKKQGVRRLLVSGEGGHRDLQGHRHPQAAPPSAPCLRQERAPVRAGGLTRA